MSPSCIDIDHGTWSESLFLRAGVIRVHDSEVSTENEMSRLPAMGMRGVVRMAGMVSTGPIKVANA